MRVPRKRDDGPAGGGIAGPEGGGSVESAFGFAQVPRRRDGAEGVPFLLSLSSGVRRSSLTLRRDVGSLITLPFLTVSALVLLLTYLAY